jgi:hypothetical protein
VGRHDRPCEQRSSHEELTGPPTRDRRSGTSVGPLLGDMDQGRCAGCVPWSRGSRNDSRPCSSRCTVPLSSRPCSSRCTVPLSSRPCSSRCTVPLSSRPCSSRCTVPLSRAEPARSLELRSTLLSCLGLPRRSSTGSRSCLRTCQLQDPSELTIPKVRHVLTFSGEATGVEWRLEAFRFNPKERSP